MKFTKLGLIQKPNISNKLQQSHMQSPKVFKIDEKGNYRMYFGSRGSDLKSRLFVSTFNLNDLQTQSISSEPIIPLGGVASFDESGMIPGSIIF